MGITRSICFGLLILVGLASCSKDQEEQYEYRDLGVSARDILSAADFTALEIEFSYTNGYEPSDSVLNGVGSFLNRYINKPAGIRMFKRAIPSPGKPELTIQEVVDQERLYRTKFTKSRVLTIHILISDAEFNQDDIFGISYWNTSMCVFGATVDRFSGRPGKVSRNHLMIMLLRHELLHLMGLVGQGTPMVRPHRDPLNGAHCNNRFCLMAHLLETDLIGLTEVMPELDWNCEDDLKNNGGK